VGYFQSTAAKVGNRNLSYWSTSPDTEVVSRVLPSINSRWTDPDASADLTPLERGGQTNYKAIITLARGSFQESKESVHDKVVRHLTNPGRVVTVTHVGPLDSATYYQGGASHIVYVSEFMNLPVAVSPTPEGYNFPAPQWSSTTGASSPQNRNSELERLLTVSATNNVQFDSDSNNRRYFEFTSPTAMLNTLRQAHTWRLSVAEPGLMTVAGAAVDKWSAKKPVADSNGWCDSGNPGNFYDNDAYQPARFVSQGVHANDGLRIMKCAAAGACTARNYTVQTVLSETQLRITTTWLTADAGTVSRRYWVFRRSAGTGNLASKKGECVIDQWFGQGPGDYVCKSNSFWQAFGPVTNTANIRVHIPAVTSGATTLSGSTGYIPDLYDGIDPTGASTPKAQQLEWNISLSACNTGASMYGGLGVFDWNNQNFIVVDQRTELSAEDSFFYQTQ